VILKNGEVWLIGCHISPLTSTSTHISTDPVRTRKLLLNAAEIRRLIGKVERAGYALMPLDMHFSKGRVKLAIGLGKGKKEYDKRDTDKKRDWEKEKAQLMRNKRG